jgi:hypothetical protein
MLLEELGVFLVSLVEGADVEVGRLACVEIHCRRDEGDVCGALPRSAKKGKTMCRIFPLE